MVCLFTALFVVYFVILKLVYDLQSFLCSNFESLFLASCSIWIIDEHLWVCNPLLTFFYLTFP
jgi:hypothetical protein